MWSEAEIEIFYCNLNSLKESNEEPDGMDAPPSDSDAYEAMPNEVRPNQIINFVLMNL